MAQTTDLSRHERLLQQRREQQEQNAALAVQSVELVTAAPTISSAAQAIQQAFPSDLVAAHVIEYDARNQPKVALYDPALLAPNPQRARIIDRNLEELAKSLDQHGQQEPVLARLITNADRQRWPDQFSDKQLLVILKGHRIYHASLQAKSMRKLRVELMLPLDGESEADYRRRAFMRAGVKLMHSVEYTVFDKVNLYRHWLEEFALDGPSDAEAAVHFEISKAQAVRLRVIAGLDPEIEREIVESGKVPADEVIYHIANRPPPEQHSAYQRYGSLNRAQLRRFLDQEKRTQQTKRSYAAGRPHNFAFVVKDESSPITAIQTCVTPKAWQERGGAKAFLKELKMLLDRPDVQEQLQRELG